MDGSVKREVFFDSHVSCQMSDLRPLFDRQYDQVPLAYLLPPTRLLNGVMR